jgi:hypothetical protein
LPPPGTLPSPAQHCPWSSSKPTAALNAAFFTGDVL